MPNNRAFAEYCKVYKIYRDFFFKFFEDCAILVDLRLRIGGYQGLTAPWTFN